MKPISIHDYFWDPGKNPPREVCVVFGKDAFLKLHAVKLLRDHVLDGDDAEFSLTRFDGNSVELKEVLREVATRPMFGGDRRLVLVEDADHFVSKNRSDLEDYAGKPSKNAVLLLVVDSFPSNTNLYKKLVETGLIIESNALPEKELPKWIVRWAKHQQQVGCDLNAAELLLERIGPEHGLLDQELAKLALMLPMENGKPKGKITQELVEQGVGSWRLQTVYQMLDKMLEGKTADAIRQLDLLILAKTEPPEILPQIAARLRQLAAATRLILNAELHGQTIPISEALKKAGITNPYFLKQAEKQLRMLGRYRGSRMYDWLLEVDLAMKGGSNVSRRLIFEQFVIKVADPRLRAGR